MPSNQEPGNHTEDAASSKTWLSNICHTEKNSVKYPDVTADCRVDPFVSRIVFSEELLEFTGDLSKHVIRQEFGNHEDLYLRLQDENAKIVQLLVDWASFELDRSKYPALKENPLTSWGTRSDELLELYTLASQYKVDLLNCEILQAMFKICGKKRWWECAFAQKKNPLAHFMEEVPQDSQMHQFLVSFLLGSAFTTPTDAKVFWVADIPDELLRLAFTRILELPAVVCPTLKGADENFGVSGFILGDSEPGSVGETDQ